LSRDFNADLQCELRSTQQLSPEGCLLVYYLSNLILLYKREEAQKIISDFGYIIEDKLCQANLLKLEGLIIMNQSTNVKEALVKFEKSCRMFKELGIYHGQALCNTAIGFLFYAKTVRSRLKLILGIIRRKEFQRKSSVQ